MIDLPPFFALFPGCLAGAIVVLLFSRWLRLLLAAFGKYPRSDRPPEGSSRIWATVFTIVNPVPWLLVVGIVVGIKHLRVGHPSAAWLWFWGATILTPLAVVWLSANAVRKSRGRNASAA